MPPIPRKENFVGKYIQEDTFGKAKGKEGRAEKWGRGISVAGKGSKGGNALKLKKKRTGTG